MAVIVARSASYAAVWTVAPVDKQSGFYHVRLDHPDGSTPVVMVLSLNELEDLQGAIVRAVG